MLRVFCTFAIATSSLAALVGLAANQARAAEIPEIRRCVFEAEKLLWLGDQGHDAFGTARTTFELFDTTFQVLTWKDFAPKNATSSAAQASGEALRGQIKRRIDGARTAYEDILSRIIAARKFACDVCLGVARYKLQAEPITDAKVPASPGGDVTVTLSDLTLREIKNEKISGQVDTMFAAVQLIVFYRPKIIEVGETSPLGITYRKIIKLQESVVQNAYDDFLEARKALGADPSKLLLQNAAYGSDDERYDCIEPPRK